MILCSICVENFPTWQAYEDHPCTKAKGKTVTETKYKVLIGIPTFDHKVITDTVYAVMAAKTRKDVHVNFRLTGFSGLTCNFNRLLCDALDGDYTHFVMLHADIAPNPGWLDKLIEVMERFQADIVSAISPIKDERGLTSTAIENIEDPWHPIRFTMKEVFKLDPSFTRPDLLLNTGLMLVDIRKPWVNQVRFHVEDAIKIVEGKRYPLFMPEDWLFSRDARAAGAQTLVATREVLLNHIGGAYHDNASPWGTCEHDPILDEKKPD